MFFNLLLYSSLNFSSPLPSIILYSFKPRLAKEKLDQRKKQLMDEKAERLEAERKAKAEREQAERDAAAARSRPSAAGPTQWWRRSSLASRRSRL
jgi:hypothetical protein